jgi:hypothetical protein
MCLGRYSLLSGLYAQDLRLKFEQTWLLAFITFTFVLGHLCTVLMLKARNRSEFLDDNIMMYEHFLSATSG